ncbi:MAG: tetratricopeptide repeat protein [Candidatus Hydrogenedentes bacterium]|nr:tetratricopeptide repeat protein [Candidatus Hydrogenedentota bacterium]
MTRKIWIVLGVLVVLSILGAAAGAVGVYLYIEHRNATWLRDAETAYAQGDWQKAKVNYERYMPQDPRNEELLLKYAKACESLIPNRQSALKGATTAYQQILGFNPGNTDVRTKLIDTYVRMNDWGSLEYYAAEWLRNAPDDPVLGYYHALALDRTGRRDEAVEAYKKLVDSGTDHSDVYGNLARLLRDQGQEKQAQSVLEKAVTDRPQDAHVRVEYARYLARTSDWTKVEALLQEAMTLAPDDPDVLMARAQSLSLRGDYAGAIDLGKRALDAKQSDINAYLVLAGAYSSLGKVDEAIAVLAAAPAEIQADNPSLPIMLVDLQLSANRFDDAHKTIEFYKSVNPNQMPIVEYFAGKELLVKGEPAAAVQRLASVVQLRPGFSPAQFALALAYIETGENELARNTLEGYLAKNPGDIRAQQLMSQRYGKPLTLKELAERANEVLNDPQVDAGRLLSAAATLFEGASRAGKQAEYGEVVRGLLAKAIKGDPKNVDAYRMLVEVSLGLGDLPAAQAALDDAAAAGAESSALALSRASIALAKGDESAAQAVFAEASDAKDFGRESYSAWAGLFASKDKIEAAQGVYDKGISKLEAANDKKTLEVEQIGLALRTKDTDGALESITRLATQIDAGTPPRKQLNSARLQVAAQLLDKGESDSVEKAKQLLDAVRAEEPDNLGLVTMDAAVLLLRDPPDYDGAETLFERAESAPGGNLRAEWGLIKIALARADFPKALTHAERALALAPLSKEVRLQMADIQMKLQRPREAEATLNELLASDPDNLDALRLLAVSFFDRNQPDKAKETLAKLEQRAKGNAETEAMVASLRGRMLLAEGSAPQAEKVLRERVTADPNDFDAMLDLAKSISAQGRHDEAATLVEDFAKAHGGEPRAWVALARFCVDGDKPDRYERASTALTRALLADPNYVAALREMLELRLRQGAYGEALALCERYLSKNPDDADMLNTKAALLVQTGLRTEEALSAADRAVSLSDRPEYLLTRGLVLSSMREYSRALRDLETAANGMSATTAQIDAALAEVYLATGHIQQARERLTMAQDKSKKGDAVNPARLNQIEQALKSQESKG